MSMYTLPKQKCASNRPMRFSRQCSVLCAMLWLARHRFPLLDNIPLAQPAMRKPPRLGNPYHLNGGRTRGFTQHGMLLATNLALIFPTTMPGGVYSRAVTALCLQCRKVKVGSAKQNGMPSPE